ncbi:MAG: hypothetical protein JSV39_04195 [Candidatus Aenigmatarchaeota archaeon]|nr:MAG: hypothetical protein JSV39_04195 [Candidatus Aenigmarchaeota archaeon]
MALESIISELYSEFLTPWNKNKFVPSAKTFDSHYKVDTNDSEIVEDARRANSILNKSYLSRGMIPLRALNHMSGKADRIRVRYNVPVQKETFYIKDENGKPNKYRIVLGIEGGFMNRNSRIKYVEKANKLGSKENKRLRKEIGQSLYNLKNIKEKHPGIYEYLGLDKVRYLNEQMLNNLKDPNYLMKVLLHEDYHEEDELRGVNSRLLKTGGGAAVVEGQNTQKVDDELGEESTLPGTDYRVVNRISKYVSKETGISPFHLSQANVAEIFGNEFGRQINSYVNSN